MEEPEKVCFVCGMGPGALGELGPQQEHELGLVHDRCWPQYREHPDVKAFDASCEEWREAKKLWIREGETLGAQRVNQQLQKEQFPFQVGEWLIRGEDEGFISGCVTPNYREAARLTGYSRQTLYKFAYVARHVPVCIRMQKLPWAIHQAVAPLGERCGQHVQKEFLQHADTAHLSVAKFRAFVNEKLAEQVELGVLKKQGVPVDPASNPNLRADQRAARFMIACWDLLPANYRKLVESPMTSTVRAKLAEELEHTAARLLACANEVRKWGELPLEDQWTQGTYKFENDQRAKAAKDRAKAANPSK